MSKGKTSPSHNITQHLLCADPSAWSLDTRKKGRLWHGRYNSDTCKIMQIWFISDSYMIHIYSYMVLLQPSQHLLSIASLARLPEVLPCRNSARALVLQSTKPIYPWLILTPLTQFSRDVHLRSCLHFLLLLDMMQSGSRSCCVCQFDKSNFV